MKPEDEFELSKTLSTILVAVATFCLSVMAFEKNPSQTIADEIFGFLGLLSLTSGAVIVDSILDRGHVKFGERLKLMNYAYPVFCTVLGAISAGILMLYYLKKNNVVEFIWNDSFLLFILTGVLILFKMMSDDDKHMWTIALLVAYACSLAVIF